MFPAWLEAAILGIVQGLTEFIPVSSSGHLVLVPYLLGWERHGLAFDVMLHVGTLGAVLVYFRAEILAIVRGLTGMDRSDQGRIYRRVGLFIVPASVPIGVVGLTLADQVESVFESPLAAAVLLLVTAGLLLGTEKFRDHRVASAGGNATPLGGVAPDSSGESVDGRSPEAEGPDGHAARPGGEPIPGVRAWTGNWRATGTAQQPATAPTAESSSELLLGRDDADPAGTDLGQLTLRHAMVAGFVQCLAVLPGVSRSGSTIAGGVFAGLTREAATRFSFLLAIPALVGATVLSLPDLADGGDSPLELLVGATAAFISGYFAVSYLVRLVSKERLTGFAYYCMAASAVGVVGYLMLGPPSTV